MSKVQKYKEARLNTMNSRPIVTKILLISPAPPPAGGIAIWTTILLKEIQQHSSVYIKHVDTAVHWKAVVNKSKWLTLIGGSLQSLRDIVRVLIAILAFRPQVLHLNTSAGFASTKDVIIMLLARLCAIPTMIQYHTSRLVKDHQTSRCQLTVALIAMRLSTCVAVLDHTSYELLCAILPQKKIIKIPNMIDLNTVDKIASQHMTIRSTTRLRKEWHVIFVGHVIREKGIVEQITACSWLPDVHLHLVGPVTAAFRQQLETFATQRLFSQRLHFYGAVSHDEVYQHILRSDILVLPSYAEGFPLSVLEGMAMTKPVVVSDVGAMPEIIAAHSAQSCGLCVEPADAESLREALSQLLNHPETWPSIGQRGRHRVESLYSSSSVVKKIIKQWKSTSNL